MHLNRRMVLLAFSVLIFPPLVNAQTSPQVGICTAKFAKTTAVPVTTPEPYHFELRREASGLTKVDWAEMASKLDADLLVLKKNPKTALAEPATVRLYLDNQVIAEVPYGKNHYEFPLRTDEQYSIRLEAVCADGSVLERTTHSLLEKTKIRSVNPANYAGEPALLIQSPIDAKLGIDPDMPAVVQKIGRSKIVFVWKNPRDPKVVSLQGEVDFQIVRDKAGQVTGYTASDKQRVTEGKPPLQISSSEVFVKVDAAFNENAFLWDDSFTCLHVLTFDPDLCRNTIRFWLDVQAHHSQGLGDIPREVLKSNGTSYNLYETIHLGRVTPNGGYNNPNILGDVVEQLVDQTGLTPENRKLTGQVLASMKSYAKWMDRHRALKDADGKFAGYWMTDLGSGMDNIGRAPNGNFTGTGYVDELARRIELEKSAARLHARLGKWQEMNAHARKAAELDKLLNDRYWSKEKGFYFDLVPGAGGKLVRQEDMPTVAGFWPLFSRSASPEQMERIVMGWYTEKTFGGNFPVRSLPPIMQELRPGSYFPKGGYWRGGNWAPTDIIKALGEERTGRPDLAADTINKKIAADSIVAHDNLKKLGHKTVFETIGADETGRPIPGVQIEDNGRVHETRKDFVGWGGTPHTFGKVRNSLGIRPVSAFGGKAKDLGKWIETVTKSPLFANTTHFGRNPLRNQSAQKKLFGEGFLEINLPFDPGSEPVVVKDYNYGGRAVDLRIEKAGERAGKPVMRVMVTSNEPLDLNLAFHQLWGSSKPGVPVASSEIVKLRSLKGGTSMVELVAK